MSNDLTLSEHKHPDLIVGDNFFPVIESIEKDGDNVCHCFQIGESGHERRLFNILRSATVYLEGGLISKIIFEVDANPGVMYVGVEAAFDRAGGFTTEFLNQFLEAVYGWNSPARNPMLSL